MALSTRKYLQALCWDRCRGSQLCQQAPWLILKVTTRGHRNQDSSMSVDQVRLTINKSTTDVFWKTKTAGIVTLSFAKQKWNSAPISGRAIPISPGDAVVASSHPQLRGYNLL